MTAQAAAMKAMMRSRDRCNLAKKTYDFKGYSNERKEQYKKIAFAGLLTALALIFSYIEALIPLAPAIPGIKLGIANIVVITALYSLGARYAFSVNVVRVIIAGLFVQWLFRSYVLPRRSPAELFFTMLLLKKTGIFSVTGVSIAGGVAHNLGQILVAAAIVSNLQIFIYFPVLIISGVISGAIIGIIAYFILQRLPNSLLS